MRKLKYIIAFLVLIITFIPIVLLIPKIFAAKGLDMDAGIVTGYDENMTPISPKKQIQFATIYKCENGHYYTDVQTGLNRYYTSDTKYNGKNGCFYVGCKSDKSLSTVVNKKLVNVSLVSMCSYFDNIMCVQSGQELVDNVNVVMRHQGGLYSATEKVEIIGDTATFYEVDVSSGQEKLLGTATHSENNRLAAILSSANGLEKGYRNKYKYIYDSSQDIWRWADDCHYTESQQLLYNYWNTWVTATENAAGRNFGFAKYSANSNIDAASKNAQDKLNSAMESGNIYSATFYQVIYNNDYNFIERVDFVNNGQDEWVGPASDGIVNTNASNSQHLIIVFPGVQKRELTVEKEWVDNNNADNNRPTSIQVKLKNGNSVEETVTLSSSNDWSHTFTELNASGNYSVEEVLDDTTKQIYDTKVTKKTASHFIITNTPKTTIAKVIKKWEDESNRDGQRPKSIYVSLYEKGNSTPIQTNIKLEGTGDTWSKEISGLPKYKNRKLVEYEFKEQDGIKGYQTTYEYAGNTTTITNSYEPVRIKVTVKKKWDDQENRDGKRIDEIKIRLKTTDANGNWTTVEDFYEGTTASNGDTKLNDGIITLNKDNDWTYVTGELYQSAGGKIKQFDIEEITVPDKYNVSYNKDSQTYTYTAINTYVPEKINITVTKDWDDDNNRDGFRKPVKVILYAESKTKGKYKVDEKTLTNADPNTVTFTDLYKYDPVGEKITYTVEEETLEKYTTVITYGNGKSSIQGSDNYSATNEEYAVSIKNTHVPERLGLTVQKVWDDDNNRDGIRDESVTIKLSANGKDSFVNADGNLVQSTVTLSDSNHWKHTFEDLYKYENGSEINYTVQELNVPEGYTVKVTKVESGARTASAISADKIEIAEAFVGDLTDFVSTSASSSASYGNNLLNAMQYLGVNIDWLKQNNLLYTKASLASSYINAGGAGGAVNGISGGYAENVALYIRYTNANPQSATGFTMGTETTSAGAPDVALFRNESRGWPCLSFPNYYYFNYLPNVAGVNTDWMLDDKYFRAYSNSSWSWPESYCTIEGWREALDRMAADGKADRYCRKLWSGLNQDGWGYSDVYADCVEANVNTDGTIIATGESVYDKLSPGDIVICSGTVEGTSGDNAHIAIYVGSANGEHYLADMSVRQIPGKSAYGGVGFTTVSELDPTGKAGTINTWYHFTTPPTTPTPTPTTPTPTTPTPTTPTPTPAVTGDGYIVTNKHEPETVIIPVTKEWDDDTDRDGLRPKSVTINLYANGTKVDSITIDGSNTSNKWTGQFPSSNNVKLYKYEKGELINYTIKEETIKNAQPYDANQKYDAPKYTTSSSSSNNASTTCGSITGTRAYKSYKNNNVPETLSGFTIINKHIPEKVQILIKKDWDDDNNRDGLRQDVVFTLKADGTKVTKDADNNSVTNPVTLNKGNGWSYTYTNLYRYRDHGTEIKYTVEEQGEPNYYKKGEMTKTTDYKTGMQTITLAIPNKHELELVEFEVTKLWDDDTDRDGLRPGTITVNLYADGTKVDAITISGANTENKWSGKFPSSKDVKLYKYKEGAEGVLIKYTIGEEEITNKQPYDETQKYDAARYTTSSSTSNINSGSTTCESISGTKDYHDSVNNNKPQTLSGFTVINKHTPEKMKVEVTKIWDDLNDLDEYRPASITCTLLSNENGSVSRAKYAAKENNTNRSDVGDIIIKDPINSGAEYSEKWGVVTVENLYRYYNHGTVINYTIEEKSITHYNEDDKYGENKVKPESNVYYNGTGADKANPKIEITDSDYPSKAAKEKDKVVKITITNKHTPHYDGYIEITGKAWVDAPDGKANDINGVFGEGDSPKEGIKVRLKYTDGSKVNSFNSSYYRGSGENIEYIGTEYAETAKDGTYTIRVNYDNSKNVYKLYENVETVKEKMKTAYVEFEYDGMTYTTVATATSGADTSKAIEDETARNNFDNAHKDVVPSTKHPDEWTDKNITAITKDVIKSFETYEDKTTKTSNEVLKYCTGKSYDQTNPDGAWNDVLTSTKYMSKTKHPDHTTCSGSGHVMSKYDVEVEVIQNVNLGLFKREQPDVAIFSELRKVEVTMNSQKYTYLYNERTEVTAQKAEEAYQQAYNEAIEKGMTEEAAKIYAEQLKMKVQFENKGTYTYRRPLNPADIAYMKQTGNQMQIFVTYEIRIGNLSSTLWLEVDNITNYYDINYKLESKEGWNTTEGAEGIKFNQAKNKSELNIRLGPQTESEIIELTYSVKPDAIEALLNNEIKLLNNAVEIQSYSTEYGENTLYAEQRTGGRTNQPYGGYDYDSHPGNANIQLKTGDDGVERLYSTDSNGNIIPVEQMEDDTDIAPSLGIIPDEEKTISGNVWEDTDSDISDNERKGDGAKTGTEKNLANAKVELYTVKEDGSMTLATLYKINEDGSINTKEAITYSNDEGNYKLGNADDGYGIVTDTYIIKYTYGEGIDGTTTSKIDELVVNARNYKSTIISSNNSAVYNVFKGAEDYEWHLKIDKDKVYSIAVDSIDERRKIEDLQYSNFSDAIHISANSKPFKLQVEFDPSTEKTKDVGTDGEAGFGKDLNVFDFGIIERAREDIFVEKTIDNIAVTLANTQNLVNGNPKDKLDYVKAIGFEQEIDSSSRARKAMSKRLVIEMDTELMQQAQLNIKYSIKVTNNSEVDYEYYLGTQDEDYDESKVRTEYYYFGEINEDSQKIKGAVTSLVDYVDTDFEWQYSENWTEAKASDLRLEGQQLVSETTAEQIKNNKYKAYITEMFSEVPIGETRSEFAYATKSITYKDENQYENHIEILKIDAKIARTITTDDDKNIITKQYKPGNYVPSLDKREINGDIKNEQGGLHEQDDDRVEVVITPPTGDTNYTRNYIIAGLVGMIVLSIGVVFIKKKILTK